MITVAMTEIVLPIRQLQFWIFSLALAQSYVKYMFPCQRKGTGLGPQHRDSIWQIEPFGERWHAVFANSLMYEIADDNLNNDSTTPGCGFNHHSKKESNHEWCLWREHKEKLLGIKDQYDPLRRLNCWHCIGYEKPCSSETSSETQIQRESQEYYVYATSQQMSSTEVVAQSIGIIRGSASRASDPFLVTGANGQYTKWFDWAPIPSPGTVVGNSESPTNVDSMLTFFRTPTIDYSRNAQIMVVDVPGGVFSSTSGDSNSNIGNSNTGNQFRNTPPRAISSSGSNWNPTWLRGDHAKPDAAKRVIWVKMLGVEADQGGYDLAKQKTIMGSNRFPNGCGHCLVAFINCASCSPTQERLLTNPNEWELHYNRDWPRPEAYAGSEYNTYVNSPLTPLPEIRKPTALQEWPIASFRDGRILILRNYERNATAQKIKKRWTRLFAMTMGTDFANNVSGSDSKQNICAEIFYLNADGKKDLNWNLGHIHKVFPSASEEYVTYQRNAIEGEHHERSSLCYARLHVGDIASSNAITSAITISDEECFIHDNKDNGVQDWYPRMTHDDRNIVFSSNRKLAFDEDSRRRKRNLEDEGGSTVSADTGDDVDNLRSSGSTDSDTSSTSNFIPREIATEQATFREMHEIEEVAAAEKSIEDAAGEVWRHLAHAGGRSSEDAVNDAENHNVNGNHGNATHTVTSPRRLTGSASLEDYVTHRKERARVLAASFRKADGGMKTIEEALNLNLSADVGLRHEDALRLVRRRRRLGGVEVEDSREEDVGLAASSNSGERNLDQAPDQRKESSPTSSRKLAAWQSSEHFYEVRHSGDSSEHPQLLKWDDTVGGASTLVKPALQKPASYGRLTAEKGSQYRLFLYNLKTKMITPFTDSQSWWQFWYPATYGLTTYIPRKTLKKRLQDSRIAHFPQAMFGGANATAAAATGTSSTYLNVTSTVEQDLLSAWTSGYRRERKFGTHKHSTGDSGTFGSRPDPLPVLPFFRECTGDANSPQFKNGMAPGRCRVTVKQAISLSVRSAPMIGKRNVTQVFDVIVQKLKTDPVFEKSIKKAIAREVMTLVERTEKYESANDLETINSMAIDSILNDKPLDIQIGPQATLRKDGDTVLASIKAGQLSFPVIVKYEFLAPSQVYLDALATLESDSQLFTDSLNAFLRVGADYKGVEGGFAGGDSGPVTGPSPAEAGQNYDGWPKAISSVEKTLAIMTTSVTFAKDQPDGFLEGGAGGTRWRAGKFRGAFPNVGIAVTTITLLCHGVLLRTLLRA